MVGSEESQSTLLEKTLRVARLNQAFQEGKEAWEVLDDLRALEKPILVDFNNVLGNNTSPIIPNSEGKSFLDALRPAGDVIIATTARDWGAIHDFLQKSGMWNDEIVLMVSPNWKFLCEEVYGKANEPKKRIFQSFRENLKSRGIEVGEFDLDVAPIMKPLSPLFNKPFDIPLIDDAAMATLHPYPGILGINVKPFVVGEETTFRDINRGVNLLEAATKVKDFYSALSH